MKRPASSGQHFRMGRFSNVAGCALYVEGCFQSGAAGQFEIFGSEPGITWTTSLQGPLLTRRGFAWRRSKAVPSNLMASRTEVGGLALMSADISAAAASTELVPRQRAIRFQEPKVLMATEKGLSWPLTVGCSMRR